MGSLSLLQPLRWWLAEVSQQGLGANPQAFAPRACCVLGTGKCFIFILLLHHFNSPWHRVGTQ